MIGGVMGKILWVDLGTGAFEVETVPEEVYVQYLGGMGLAAWALTRAIRDKIDALGPENILGFLPGLLTGTGAGMAGRWMAVGKSPLTGTWGDANCGGTLGPALKACGWDGIFLRGISPRPVYLWLSDGQAELRLADDLWGLDADQTETILRRRGKEESGREVSVACIGTAGEKRSLIAGIVNDYGRLAARSGLGAVMGAKHLKAVAASGTAKVPVRNPEELSRLNQKFLKWVNFQPPFLNGRMLSWLGWLMGKLPLQMRLDGMLYKIFLSKWGTISMNQMSVEMGDAPVRNWSGSNMDFGLRTSQGIDPDRIIAREVKKYHCAACPLGCGGLCRAAGGRLVHKPEYESVTALATLTGNNDLEMVFEVNEMLNLAGMDSISAGATIAFAIDCFQRGLLNEADTGGLRLEWGKPEVVRSLAQMMIAREGIGDLLADGSLAAAQRIGGDAELYAAQSGGQELPMHDGRNDPGFALHAAVEPTPGRHTNGAYMYYEMFQLWTRVPGLPVPRWMFYRKGSKYRSAEEKGRAAAACSQFMQLANAAGLCLFGGFVGAQRIPFFDWLNAVSGLNKTPAEYMEIGRRIQSLRQAFNARQGAPARHKINLRATGQPPLERGSNCGRSVPLDALIPAYWEAMGWDKNGGVIIEDLRF